FGDPHLKVRTVHIAGTNGKGSTAAFTESILRSAGYRVGLYTSPHLLDFRERIQIDRVPISQTGLFDLVSRVKRAADALGIAPTFFEFGTVMAFIHFFESKTDWNVIEVGLGGRLDATNVCQAKVSIITSISLDHAEYLGSDLKQIAGEKAAIIKKNGTVIAYIEEDDVFEVVRRQAEVMDARLLRLGTDFKTESLSHDTGGQRISYQGGREQFDGLEISLIGRHQAFNAALAVACCLELRAKRAAVTGQAIRDGLKNTRWEGRLEVAGTRPILLLDCAHNPDGVIKLTQAVRDYFSYRRCHVVLGIMQDKPCKEMIEIISSIADRIILTKPRTARSWEPRLFLDNLPSDQKVVDIIEEIHYAIDTARKTSTPDDLICVTGSIFTVAEAKQIIVNEGVTKTHNSASGDFPRGR
ncbi:MAG: bifunctional folylpolyglutamate synthase/dihydrofolate synthase, partial [Nitrospinae bacterium]|nr:bifunctional folylpolyglutamate synthase/dihydrofolate synthase [Nitrospinota bacterium]